MFTEPASRLSPVHSRQQAHLPRGGNLARAHSTRAGHSSFLGQTPDKFGADDADCHEAWASLRARGAGAAMDRHILRCAESRPLPFLEVDDLAHWCFSRLQCEKYLEAFPPCRKILPRSRKFHPPMRNA